ncbi:MAG TPA: Hsp20/alpha crystallin family protein [Chloroflexi bacterium]|jgi:HSP20 family protein|nr:Hsp20/alpha crystallin family protein [Chloroflexota bacterium]
MSSLMRWDPFTVIEPLSDAMDRFFTDGLAPTRRGSLFEMDAARALAAMDMYETDDAVVVTVAVPGVAPEDVQVSVVGDTLTIRGEIKTNDQAEKGRYLCRERASGRFTRSVTLPGLVEADKAQAEFERGILTVRVPKTESARPKTIKVKAR